ncbi:hypothetical protein GCM10010923_03360 [Blastomonas marina]|uniref:Uncharacterized protein n=1 Tax=Blastomonas marina TaxID=1867408 RepID=A0ABQ1F343_9SPHN|nr:hypothetical protein [Blastomonas marina]GFZ98516.1 hypothetical protein GCM10010923_03360 [Blastomonas marina]
MADIDDYIAAPELALIDAAEDSAFDEFILPEDYTFIVVNQGGIQAQVRALSAFSAASVIRRLIERMKQQGAAIQDWICKSAAEGGFDLCAKLASGRPLAEIMKSLQQFLQRKIVILVNSGVGLLTFATGLPDPISVFTALFAVIGLTSEELARYCGC